VPKKKLLYLKDTDLRPLNKSSAFMVLSRVLFLSLSITSVISCKKAEKTDIPSHTRYHGRIANYTGRGVQGVKLLLYGYSYISNGWFSPATTVYHRLDSTETDADGYFDRTIADT
jgi:hypothetical protein